MPDQPANLPIDDQIEVIAGQILGVEQALAVILADLNKPVSKPSGVVLKIAELSSLAQSLAVKHDKALEVKLQAERDRVMLDDFLINVWRFTQVKALGVIAKDVQRAVFAANLQMQTLGVSGAIEQTFPQRAAADLNFAALYNETYRPKIQKLFANANDGVLTDRPAPSKPKRSRGAKPADPKQPAD